jgi:hypothetical protein
MRDGRPAPERADVRDCHTSYADFGICAVWVPSAMAMTARNASFGDDAPGTGVTRMTITLELDEEQSWHLVAALGCAWSEAMKTGQAYVAENILELQNIVRERQDAAYALLRDRAK